MSTSLRRSKHDILADIMGILHEPAGITRIMYQANLSYAQMIHYAGLLEQNGITRRTDDGKLVLTEKGRRTENLFRASRSFNVRLEELING